MHTDKEIYLYLATGPEAFRIITGGMTLDGPYEFESITLKSLEQRIDAIFTPIDHDGTTYVVEFQAQPNNASWGNLLSKIGLYIGQNPTTPRIQGIIIFPSRAIEISSTAWMCSDSPNILKVVYLEDFFPQLLAQQPNNPYVAALAPLMLTDTLQLQQLAPQLWHTVHQAALLNFELANLEQILASWFFIRFRDKEPHEVLAMLQIMTPLQETQAYNSIFAKGKLEGEAYGIAKGKVEGEAVALKRLIMVTYQ